MSNSSSSTATDEETLEQIHRIQEDEKALPLISSLLSLTDLL